MMTERQRGLTVLAVGIVIGFCMALLFVTCSCGPRETPLEREDRVLDPKPVIIIAEPDDSGGNVAPGPPQPQEKPSQKGDEPADWDPENHNPDTEALEPI